MCMLNRRFQILFDDEQFARVTAAAGARKISAAEVIREAVDAALPPQWPDRFSAGEAILSAAPMAVPADVADLKAELDDVNGRRG